MKNNYTNLGRKTACPIGPTLEEVQKLLERCGKMLGVDYKLRIKNEESELSELLEIKERIKRKNNIK